MNFFIIIKVKSLNFYVAKLGIIHLQQEDFKVSDIFIFLI